MDLIFLFFIREVSVSLILLFLLGAADLSGTADFLGVACLLGASSSLSGDSDSDSYSKISLFSILFYFFKVSLVFENFKNLT
jgi:hypothetical protein